LSEPQYDIPSFSRPDVSSVGQQPPKRRPPKNQLDAWTIIKHTALFLITFGTVTFMGLQFVGQTAVSMDVWSLAQDGAVFAALLLAFLGTHEFGHYFAAVHHNIRVTLPYFIPVPFAIGTMGAVIRIKEKVSDTKKLFDIGIAGPLSGFVVSLLVLLIGFFTLPEPSFINNFSGHEAIQNYVAQHGTYPDHPMHEPSMEEGPMAGQMLVLGNTLLYSFLSQFFEHVPPMFEMYHYPFLFAGWLGLFFTALNLMPIGQLDGGHILYSLIGYRNHQKAARVFYTAVSALAGIGFIPLVGQWLGGYSPLLQHSSWILWAGILFVLMRRAFHGDHHWIAPALTGSLIATGIMIYFVIGDVSPQSYFMWMIWLLFINFAVGVEHPPALYERRLDPTRRFWGWVSMGIFLLCFSPNPIYMLNIG
jgi:hypothetical protein